MIYQFGTCAFDVEREELSRDGAVVAVEPKALRVLRYLIERRNRLVPRSELLEACWPGQEVNDSSLNNCMSRIREAIGQRKGEASLIQTVHRRGYRFVARVREPQLETLGPAPEEETPDDELPDADSRAVAGSQPRPQALLSRPPRPPVPQPAPLPDASQRAQPLSFDSSEASGTVRRSIPAQHRPAPASISPADRRHVSVLCCTPWGTDAAIDQLDSELRYELTQRFVSACAAIVEREGGHLCAPCESRVVVYFGYPHAHEDNATRAVRCGLALVSSLAAELACWSEPTPARAIRVGIASGLMIMDSGGPGRPPMAIGDASDRAAGLCALAQPNTLLISEDTHQLVEHGFDCEPIDQPGAGEPAAPYPAYPYPAYPYPAYEVRAEREVQARIATTSRHGLTPLVGRTEEMGLLLARWDLVKDGQGQVVRLLGEAGIGKSRLVHELAHRLADEPHLWLECRGSPYHRSTALYPLIEPLSRLLGWRNDDTWEVRLEKLGCMLDRNGLPAFDLVPLLSLLSSPPVARKEPALSDLLPEHSRRRALQGIAALFLVQSERRPVVLVLEDLHWVDPTTVELIELLMSQVPAHTMYILVTSRLDRQPAWHCHSYVAHLVLARLARAQLRELVQQAAGDKQLSESLLTSIVDKADGVPLFAEQLTKAVLESETGAIAHDGSESAACAASMQIPVTLHDSLMARLDRLGPARSVAQIAAVIGRQFSESLLQAVVDLDAETLRAQLSRLVDAEILYRRGWPPHTTYIFKHALLADIAAHSLLNSTRQLYHQRIVQAMNERFADIAEGQPELMAHHCTAAGYHDKAIGHWRTAAELAVRRSNHVEAITHCREALGLLSRLSDTPPRREEKLRVLIALGLALMSTKGFSAAEVEAVYGRARELCSQIGDPQRLFPILVGLRRFYRIRGRLQIANQLAEQLQVLAQQAGDRLYLLEAHSALGSNLCFCGEFSRSYEHAARGLKLYKTERPVCSAFASGVDLGVDCLTYMSAATMELGYPEQALQRMDEALALAAELDHPLTLARALAGAALLHQRRGEPQQTAINAESAIALCSRHGFTQYRVLAAITLGWALNAQGHATAGRQRIIEGIIEWKATGADVLLPVWLAYLAEVYRSMNRAEDGISCLTEAFALIGRTGERRWAAELHRLKGTLLLSQSQSNRDAAEGCFLEALGIARSQQATSWELRGSVSLARLWHRTGRTRDAYHLLAPIYKRFTEGFDTPDLRAAKALLDEVA
ncbi:MAG: AAA family ATPase [Gammaproteobacteria bacterium]|nr:AAA family ATPase [Gammaproteobacteria bacterium]